MYSSRLEIQIDSRTGEKRLKSLQTQLGKTDSTALAAQRRLREVARSANGAAGSFRMARGATQQFGYQIQDVAVQLGMGTNAFQVLGQQGSQVASIFGPGGALLGAVLAVGGAIGGSLFRSLSSASEETESLAERTRELTEQLGHASSAQRAIVRGDYVQQIQEQKQAVSEAVEEIGKLSRQLKESERAAASLSAEGIDFINTEKVKEAENRIQELWATVDNGNSSIEAIRNQMQEYEEAITGVNEANGSAQRELGRLIESLEIQSDTLGMNERQVALYEAARLGANAADVAAINNSYDLITAWERQQTLREASQVTMGDDPLLQRLEAQARGEKIITEMIAEEEETRLNTRVSMNRQALALAGGVAGQMTDLIRQAQGEQSAAYKAAFLLQQGLQVGQTIMATETAAASALAPPPIGVGPLLGPAYATGIRAMGYTSAGLIAAQAIGSVLGQAHDGHDSIPNSGTWNLEKGERVMSKGLNRDMTQYLARENKRDRSPASSGDSPTTIINQTSARIGNVEERRMPDGEKILIIQEAVSRTAREMNNPNSEVSRSLARNLQTTRSR